MGRILDGTTGGNADILNRKDYLNRKSYIMEKYDVDPKERDKRLDKLLKNYLKDQKLIKNYGEDAMRSKGFNTNRGKPQGRGGKTYMDKPKSINAGASRPATQSSTRKGN